MATKKKKNISINVMVHFTFPMPCIWGDNASKVRKQTKNVFFKLLKCTNHIMEHLHKSKGWNLCNGGNNNQT